MKKRINSDLKRIASFVLCIALVFMMGAMPKTQASTLDDLKKQYEQLAKKIAQSEKELAEISSDKGEQEAKLRNLNAQISAIDGQMDILNSRIGLLNGDISELNGTIAKLESEIGSLDTQISTAQTQISEKQATIQTTLDKMLERLRAAYMAGNTSEIEILLSSEDLSTFLTRSEMLRQIAENDNRLIKSLEADMKELDSLTKTLEGSKQLLVENKAKVSSEKAAVLEKKKDATATADSLSDRQRQASYKFEATKDILATLDKNSQTYLDQIARYEREQEKIDKAIDKWVRDNASQGNGNNGQMTWPLPYSNTYVSSYYGYRSDPGTGATKFHGGVDISMPSAEGKRIVAVQDGTVIMSGTPYNDGCKIVIIDHEKGLSTLYGHCSYLIAKTGDKVTKGQLIAYVGHTGYAFGSHLHFEVRINNGDTVTRVNPMNYMKKP